MLKIKNLNATTEETEVLHDINLEVKENEVHAIIGPEKAGKTALMMLLAGVPYVDISSGSMLFKNKKLASQSLDERSRNGIVGVFQDLIEIPNVTNWNLMKEILKARKDKRNLTAVEEYYKTLAKGLGLDEDHGDLDANGEGMDFAQAIKNEVLILMMLDPVLALVDDIDEKLSKEDQDIVAENIKDFAHVTKRATIVLSKDKDFLEAINPTHVHIMVNGHIALSGGKELLQRIEEDGYPELSAS
jgi:Fe-S cluster assembly ATP-binding protein